jgi:tight adherence protein C
MGGLLDVMLGVLLVSVVAGLLWVERARLTSLVARPQASGDPAAAQGYYWRLTRQAGFSPSATWPVYMGAKVTLAVVLAALALPMVGLWAWLPAVGGFVLPDAVLAYMRRRRQAKIRSSLSFFVDLLLSLLQAGLGIEEAFGRTAGEGLPKGHPLADEASRVVAELKLGRDRTLGFQVLADRTGVVELRSLSNALAAGLGHGSSLEATLKGQADLLRARRREEGLKRLNVASAKVLLPLMLCGFPVFVVLVLAPLGIRIMQGFADLGRILRP